MTVIVAIVVGVFAAIGLATVIWFVVAALASRGGSQ